MTVVGGGYFVATGGLAARRAGHLRPVHRDLPVARGGAHQLHRAVPEGLRGVPPLHAEVLARAARRAQTRPGARPLDGSPRRCAAEAGGAAAPASVRYRGVRFGYDGEREVLARPGPGRAGGRDRGARGAVGRRQDHHVLASAALLRPGGGVGGDRRHRRPRDVPVASLREAIGIVQQDVYLFGGTVRENIAYGRPRRVGRRSVEAGRSARERPRVRRGPAGGLRHVRGRARGAAVGRAEAAHRHRARVPDGSRASSSWTRPRARSTTRASGPSSARSRSWPSWPHDARHRAPAVHDTRSADLIAVVEDGRVGELGTHDELLALGGTYARYCEMQFGPTGWPVAAQGRGE